MTKPKYRKPISAAMFPPLAVAAYLFGVLLAPIQACAQQPGTGAVVSLSLPSSAEPVQGWSVKRGLLGRPVYASAEGQQIGTVLDLVVTPAPAPFVLIIGAAGAIEIGGHSVAVPLDDVVEQGGVLILPNVTRASLKAMQRFTYSKAGIHRTQFIRATSAQLAEANCPHHSPRSASWPPCGSGACQWAASHGACGSGRRKNTVALAGERMRCPRL